MDEGVLHRRESSDVEGVRRILLAASTLRERIEKGPVDPQVILATLVQIVTDAELALTILEVPPF